MLRTCFVTFVCTFLLMLSVGSLSAQDGGSGIVFTGCPPYVEGNHCDSMFYQVVAVDLGTGKQCPEMKYILVSGPGTINQRTGLWQFHPERDSLISNFYGEVEIAAYKGHDTTNGDENCRFGVQVYDQYPVFSSYCGAHITVLPGDTIAIPIEISDTDPCDEPKIDSVTIQPEPSGFFAFDIAARTVVFEPNAADAGKSFEVRVAASSGPAVIACPFWFDVFQPEPVKFRIATAVTTDSRPGDTISVDIILDESAVVFDRVNMTVGFDNTRLRLIDVERGPEFFSEETGCSWDRLDWFGPSNCVYSGPELVRLVGRALASSGSPEPPCLIPEDLPATFATLKFVVAEGIMAGEQFAPVSFYWCSCSENYLMSTLPRPGPYHTYMPLAVYSPDGQLIPPDTIPGYSGASDDCYYNFMSGERYRLVEYYDGGVNISIAPPEATYSVRIGYQDEVIQGAFQDVPITLEKFDHMRGLGGFDLLVGYDASALAFQLAYEGDLYDSCGWEYFTYRFGPYGNCGDACPSGMLRIIGFAEANNGPYHPGCQTPTPYVGNVPVILANLRFLVSNDTTLECQFVPLRFFWYECGDNTLSDYRGSELYLSSFVYDYGDLLISKKAEFPTYFGAQDKCTCDQQANPPCKVPALRAVDFYNGGLDIVCGDSADYHGDVNCNGLAYGIADAVMFSNYFIVGLAAFGNHPECSIAASDANYDGMPLTIEDLVFLIRVMIGDVQPQKQPSPNPARFILDPVSGDISVSSVDSLGAVYLIVAGEITPVLLANQMTMTFGWDTGWTRILIYSLEAGTALTSGEFMSIPGATGIVSVEAATFDGRAVTTKIEISGSVTESTYSVRIGHPEEVLLGTSIEVPVMLERLDKTQGLAGFDFLIAYDASALMITKASPGDLLDSCEWEYFTYRYGANADCGDPCPNGILRVIGMAETNNGPHHPNPDCAMESPGWISTVPVTLTTMSFLVSSDLTHECQFVPIRFFWSECGDNALVNHDGSEFYLSSDVFELGITTSIAGVEAFPTYRGAQQECFAPGSRVNLRAVDFYNGGVDIACWWYADATGDINLNGISYEIADALMFSNYFMEGVAAFGDHVQGSIAASDVNKDGLPLTIEDLAYMWRIIVGDALPFDRLTPSPNPATFTWDTQANAVSVSSIDSLGAVYLIVAGEITPALLADQMEMKFGWDTGWTRILIYSADAGIALISGDFVSIPGALGIVSIEAATFDARAVTEIISDITDVGDDLNNLPLQFALHANYPNPFNPTTTIRYDLPELADVRISVYNVVGQVVRTLVDRQDSPGQHEVIWDGRDDSGRPVSSGIYLYRMTAGDFTQSRKMLLLK